MASNNTHNESKTMSQAAHKAEVIAEVSSMSNREEIESRMNGEENTTVRIWIWQYLQTL